MNALAFTPLPRDEQHRLIVENRGLVFHFARMFMHSIDYDDAVSVGHIGLVEAARRYDPSRGTFGSYAGFWIRAQIYRQCIHDRGLPDSAYGRTLFFGLRKVIRDLEAAGEATTDERVAGLLGIPVEVVADCRPRLMQADTRLDSLIHKDTEKPENAANSLNLRDLVANHNPEDEMTNSHDAAVLTRDIEKHLGKLTPREQDVIRRRFFGKDETLAEIGADMGLSRERVRQVEAIALGKLKKMLSENVR